jgi:hypothetical protein
MDLDGFLASANLAHHGEGLVALGCTEVADLHELTDDDCAASAAMKPLEIRRMRRKLGENMASGAGLASHDDDVGPHPTVAAGTQDYIATLHSSNKEQQQQQQQRQWPVAEGSTTTNEFAARRVSYDNPASLLANDTPSLAATLLQDQPVATTKSRKPAIIGAVVLALLAIIAVTLFTQIGKSATGTASDGSCGGACVDAGGEFVDEFVADV